MNRTRWTLLSLIVALGHAGCSPTLMPTPVAFDSGVDPIGETPVSERDTTARVFIVTDRKPSSRTNPPPATFYSNDRDYGLRVGVATVELARNMTWDELHAQSLKTKRTRNPEIALTGYEQFGALWTDVPTLDAASVENREVTARFGDELRAALAASDRNEIYIFVHGFNTRFAPNTGLAAELHYYLGRRGAFISYEWPSRGSMFKYDVDKAAAQYSVRYFRLLLTFLAEETDAQINIIAHSAGATVAVGGVSQVWMMGYAEGLADVRARYRIRHLVLVAPDMDLGLFENAIHDEMPGVPEEMSIYISTRDKALSFSGWLHGFATLGSSLTQLTRADLAFLENHPDVEIIDVGGAEKDHGSWLGHSYFHVDPWVSSDVIMTLRFGPAAPPQERGLVKEDGDYLWSFPKDYPERARAAAARLYGGGEAE